MANLMYDISNPYIEYKTNKEYRKVMRSLFKMDQNALLKDLATKYNTDTLDEESLDELLYNSDTVMKQMDTLFECTRIHPLFNELYLSAAAKMISMDPSMGQVILFSYNYLYLYHPCLCVFLRDPDDFHKDCICYIQLKQKLDER